MYRYLIVNNDNDLLNRIFVFRYQIYCEELGWISSEDCPDGKETDEYDGISFHLCAMLDEEVVGCARVIRPEMILPTERFLRIPLGIDRNLTCEISRLITSKKHRKGIVEFGLLREIYHLCLRKGISFAYALMENKLKRQLAFRGIVFNQIGEPGPYIGADSIMPCLLDLSDIPKVTPVISKGTWEYLKMEE